MTADWLHVDLNPPGVPRWKQVFNQPMFPDIEVRLTGVPSFGPLSLVADALRDAGLSAEEVSAFRVEALSGTYEDMLRTCMNWVTIK